uniref:CRIB domain-containing protein n=1 Tax=Varanus komodoensis TaxID=61221 RepID=A0A8D2L3P2_VARKO
MPAKTPIYLKTSTPKRGRKRRLRDVLSSDMISLPLGDFRHSAHIGLDGEGDMFGELSFLQGKHDLLPQLGHRGGCSGAAGDSFGRCPAGASCHALLRSATSLPVFGGSPGQDQAPPKPPRLHLEELPSGGQQRSMSVSCAEGGRFRSGASLHPRNQFRLQQPKSRLDIRKSFLPVRAVRQWDQLPGEVGGSPALEPFKAKLDSPLRGRV